MEYCNLHAAGVNDPGYNKRSSTIRARSQHNVKHQPKRVLERAKDDLRNVFGPA